MPKEMKHYGYELYHSLPVISMAYISAYPMVQPARENLILIAIYMYEHSFIKHTWAAI